MKNLTITLDEEVARWIHTRAAEQNKSVSGLVRELLRENMLEDKTYQMAMQQFLLQPPQLLKAPCVRYPNRGGLYSR